MPSTRLFRSLFFVAVVLGLAPVARAQSPLTITNGPNFGTWSTGPILTGLSATGGTGSYTWSVSGGPAALQVLQTPQPWFGPEASGTLAAVLKDPQTYSFTLRVTDSTGTWVEQLCTITTTTLMMTDNWQVPDAFVGEAYDFALSKSGGSGGSLTFTGNNLPPWLSVSSSGHVTAAGAGLVPGSHGFNVTLTEGEGAGAVSVGRGFTLNVYAVHITTPGLLPSGTPGSPYSVTLAATGGSGSYTWSGGVPGGFSLNASTGVLSATNAPGGTYNFSVQATDSGGQTSNWKNFTVNIVGTPPTLPSLNPPFVVEDYTIGESRSLPFNVSGGVPPYTWSVTGLPPGLSLRTGAAIGSWNWPTNAEICCTATAVGSYPVTVSVTDSSAWTPDGGGTAVPVTVQYSFMLRVTDVAFNYPPNATLNTPYSYKLVVYGGAGSPTFENLGGILPTGITFNAATGTFLGTPLEVGGGSIRVRVTDNGQALVRSIGVNVTGPGGNVGIGTNNDLGDTTLNAPYDFTFWGWGPPSLAWSLESGPLPPGLVLETNGRLHGTPTSAGSYTFRVRAADASNASNAAVREFNLRVSSIVITMNIPWAQAGSDFTGARLTASGGSGEGYVWTLAPGSALPPGLALAADGTLSGRPTSAGQFNFQVTVTDSAGTTRSQWTGISVYPAGVSQPVFINNGPDLGSWTLGELECQLNASGGNGTYAWALVSGSLPPGVSLRTGGVPWFSPPSSAGLIGVATLPGVYQFTLSATSGGQTRSQLFTMTISPLNVRDNWQLPDAFINTAYSYTFHPAFHPSATPSAVTWSVQNGQSLPPGFQLNPSGMLTCPAPGPQTPGTFQVSLVATSANGDKAYRTFQLAVSAVQITTETLPNATQGTPYSVTISASGGTMPYTWSNGWLPNGLAFTAGPGGDSVTISGTPTGSGTWNVDVTATDDSTDRRFYTKHFTLNVMAVPATLPSLNTGFTFDDATVGVPRTYGFWGSGGQLPYHWSIVNAPPGMDLRTTGTGNGIAAEQAELWGVVLAAGTYSFDVSLTDSSPTPITVTRTYTIKVSPLMLPWWGGIPAPTYNTLYTPPAKFYVIGGEMRAAAPVPYRFEILSGKLPRGMSLADDGTYSGRPEEAGTFNARLRVTDGAASTNELTQNYNFWVSGGPSNTVWINSGYQMSGTVGSPFSFTLNACCLPQGYAWQADSTLPAWLSLNTTTGVLSGTPSEAGVSRFLIRVYDPTYPANFNVREFVLTVSTLQFNGSWTLPYANVGTAYTQTLTATGTGTATWSVAADSATPPGLTLTSAGVLSGTPTSPGQFWFNVILADGAGYTKTINLSLTVYPPGARPPMSFNMGPNLGSVTVGPWRWQLQASAGTPPYHYALSPGADIIDGMRVQDAGQPQPTWFSTTPTPAGGFIGVFASPGTFTTSIRATDGTSPTAATIDRPVTIVVTPVAVTSLSPLPDPIKDVPYSVTLTAAGGVGPYLWSLVNGQLPPGLTLSAQTGTISGTPTTAGSYWPVLVATDTNGAASSGNNLQMNVQPFAIAGDAVLFAVANTPYSATFSAPGCATCTWSWNGNLPGGVSFNAGILSGTPTGSGYWTGNVRATVPGSGTPPQSASKNVTLFVQGAPAPPIQLNFPSSIVATIGERYSFGLNTNGGTPPYTWEITGGTLPAGMSLQRGETAGNNDYPGLWYLGGVPVESGSFPLTLRVSDNGGQTVTTTGTLEVSTITIDGNYRNLPITGSPGTYGALGQPLVYDTPYTQPLLALGGNGNYTWTVDTGSVMPSGLALSADGVVSGRPGVTGTYNTQVRVTDSSGAWYSGNVRFNITSGAGGTLTFSNNADLGTYTVGSPGQITLTPSGGTAPYTVSLAPGSSLPAGFALLTDAASPGAAGSTVLAFTPSSGGTFSFTLEVRDSAGLAGGKTFTIRVMQATVDWSGTLPDATKDAPYAQPLYAWGTGVTWTVMSGYSLPPGLTLTTGGLLSGTPTATGSYTFSLRITDAAGLSTSRSYTLLVSSLAISDPAVLPAGTVGASYSYTLAGGGATRTFSRVSGSLPPGLSLSSAGTISGTPSSGGGGYIYNFTVQVTDTNDSSSFRKQFALPINLSQPAPFSTDGADTTTVILGQSFSYPLNAYYGAPPYSWTVEAGALPPGLSLYSGSALGPQYAPGTTVIAGAATAAGTSTPTFRVTDSRGNTATFSLTIVVSPIALLNTLHSGTFNATYAGQLTAFGGTPPYKFALGESSVLPAGLSLSQSGLISGTPIETGTRSFEVRVTDDASREYRGLCNLTINATTPRTISPNTPAVSDLNLGIYRTVNFNASSFGPGSQTTPFTWSLDPGSGPVPPGLTLTSSTTGTNATLTGIPTSAGLYPFRLRVTDPAGNFGVRAYTLVVSPIQILSSNDDAMVGVAMNQPLVVSGGTRPYTVTLAPGATNVLPPGLSMDASGTLSGTPTTSGEWGFSIKIADSAGNTFTRARGLWIWPTTSDHVVPLQPYDNRILSAGAVGTVYSYNLQNGAYGGTQPYRWTLVGGSLPPGLQIATGSGSIPDYITGIPTTVGSYSFSLKVTDSSSPARTGTINATMNVITLAVAPLLPPAGVVGTPYSLSFTPSGGTPPYTVALVGSSSMPPGLAFSGVTLSGTPTAPGRFTVYVTVSDSATPANTVVKGATINIDSPATPAPYTTVDQTLVQFNYMLGGPLPSPVSIGIRSMTTNVGYEAAVLGVPGASLVGGSGTTPAAISLGFTNPAALSALSPGVYGGVVSVRAPQANNGSNIVPVKLTVSAAPVCGYSLSASSVNFENAGGPASFSVTTNAACSWSPVSDADWIVVTGGGGFGSGTVYYEVAWNPDMLSRTGTITVAGHVFTVTQLGALCSFLIDPPEIHAAAGASTGTLFITASNPGCQWFAAPSAGWLHITSPASGVGGGTVSFAIDATPMPMPRSGSMELTGDAVATVTVSQAGVSCTVTLGTASITMPAGGGSGTVAVLSAPCGYSLVVPPGVTITSPGAGVAPTTVSFTVAANTSTSPRTLTMQIGGQSFAIVQAGVTCSVSLGSASPVYAAAGDAGTIAVTTAAPCGWTASPSAGWVVLGSGSSGTGTGTVSFTVAANTTTYQRTASVTIGGQSVQVTQAGTACTYALRSTTGSMPAAGGAGSVAVSAAGNCSWTAVSNAAWLAIVSSDNIGTGNVYFQAQANPSAAPRTGTLTIAGQTFTVTQAGAPCTYSLSATGASVADTGGTGSLTFTTAMSGCSPAVQSYSSWITATATFDGTGGTVTYTVQRNGTASIRSGRILVGDQVFTITQLASTSCTYSLNAWGATFSKDGGDGTVLGSASMSPCTPAVGSSPEIDLGVLTLANNIFNQPYTVDPYVSSVIWVRVLEINFGGQIFKVKQTSW